MEIALASDHAALRLKNEIITHLKKRGVTAIDFGTLTEESVDYPDFALKVAEEVAQGKCRFGILVCGTGIGMSIAANKVPHIRCAHCSDTFSAKATRAHNDANILAIGERTVGVGLALDIVDSFIDTPFSGEARHQRRIDKITQIEEKYLGSAK